MKFCAVLLLLSGGVAVYLAGDGPRPHERFGGVIRNVDQVAENANDLLEGRKRIKIESAEIVIRVIESNPEPTP